MGKFKQRVCVKCGDTFYPNGSVQKYCGLCKIIADKERKLAFYIRQNPNAYKPFIKRYCCVCGEPFSSSFKGKPYCNKHYLRMKIHGAIEIPKRKCKWGYTVEGDIAYLHTKSGKDVIIDSNKLYKCKDTTWCVDTNGYAIATINSRRWVIQRYLLQTDDFHTEVDHINGNPLDNKMQNLRICTHSENSKNLKTKKNNTSGHAGVRIKGDDKYQASIMINRKSINLGLFSSFDQAVQARCDAELKYFGKFSPSLCRS